MLRKGRGGKVRMEEIYSEFYKWIMDQPKWIQEAIYIIYHHTAMTDNEIVELSDMCLKQIKKQDISVHVLDSSLIIPATSKSFLQIETLRNIKGVNALASDARLDFNTSGVTAIYGLNGAGKSGYMRIFKKVSAHPNTEEIQTNVFKNSEKAEIQCCFDVLSDGNKMTVDVNLAEDGAQTALSQCDVFDSIISGTYIEKQNSVSYEPFVFTVLSTLAEIAAKIKKELERRKTGAIINKFELPKEFENYDKSEWLYDLSDKSRIDSNCQNWLDEDELQINDLKRILEAENIQEQIEKLKIEVSRLNSFIGNISNIQNLISQDKEVEILAAFEDVVKKKDNLQAAEMLFSNKADDIDKISISIDSWKNLWRNAQTYLVATSEYHFGDDKPVCPLCHQTLTDDTLSRYNSVNEFINGVANEEYEKSKSYYEKRIKEIQMVSKLDPELLKGFVTAEIFTNINNYLLDVSKLNITSSIEEIKALFDKVGKSIAVVELKKYSENAMKKLEEYKMLMNSEERAVLQSEFLYLKYRKWVYDHKKDIENAINVHVVRMNLDEAIRLTNTNRLTTESNILAEKLITDAYVKRFDTEIKNLAPDLKIKIEKGQSQRGKSPYKIVLDTEDSRRKKPELILSEGEQRIVSLAAFFADATGRNFLSPIIIDDPISSLDCNYEERTADRVSELSLTRQVIVFTHRISFLVCLKEACIKKNTQLVERHIRGTKNGKGVSAIGDEYTGDIIGQLNTYRNQISKTKKDYEEGSIEYESIKGRICQQFRICVERSVEDILINGVVKRFKREVSTLNKIDKLAIITNDDCTLIEKMMSKYSFTEHSQPGEACPCKIEIDELDGDIVTFVEWAKSHKKKMNNSK